MILILDEAIISVKEIIEVRKRGFKSAFAVSSIKEDVVTNLQHSFNRL